MARSPPTPGSGVTAEGAVIALATGAVICCGYSLIHDKDLRRSVKMTAGGALCVMGAFLFAPAGLRKMWMGDYTHI